MVSENNFLKDQEKEIQFHMEKLKLKETIEKINDEILSTLDKRKGFMNYIKEYRKENLEEYRDDEDMGIEYFDHDKFLQEESFKIIDKRLKELTELKLSPYFGRITFLDKDIEEVEDIYIGKYGLKKEGAYLPTIVDWRAPVASLFYAGTLGEYHYECPAGRVDVDIEKRRQYIIKRSELLGLFDSDLDVKDEILQMVLSSNTNEKLKDIILTIQKEQDEIIRQPRNGVVVVNGVAGSGKTTIALHRIAYLLYNFRKYLENKVLILGPNFIFMEYISRVLPSLGEDGVKQNTFREFALSLLNIPEEIMDFSTKMQQVLEGDKSLEEDILKKTSESFIDNLDGLIEKLEKNYYNVENIMFRGKVVVNAEEIKAMFSDYYKSMPLFRRAAKIKRICISRIKDERDNIFRDIKAKYKEKQESLSESDREFQENDFEFKRRLEIRDLIRDVMNTRKSLNWLDGEDVYSIYKKYNGDGVLIDEDLAPMLYLEIKLWGLKSNDDIKHVVIDEAQDYSSLQFKVIQELTGAKSFTVVGDCNQRLIVNKNIPMMHLNDILESESIKEFNLKKSYRSTKQIMEYANSFTGYEEVPFVREGEKVQVQNFKNIGDSITRIKETIELLLKDGLENIAVICRTSSMTKEISKQLKKSINIRSIDNEYMIYNGGVVVIPSYLAKGLEFDGVIIVDENKEGQDLVKYIMSTRALHRLYDFRIG